MNFKKFWVRNFIQFFFVGLFAVWSFPSSLYFSKSYCHSSSILFCHHLSVDLNVRGPAVAEPSQSRPNPVPSPILYAKRVNKIALHTALQWCLLGNFIKCGWEKSKRKFGWLNWNEVEISWIQSTMVRNKMVNPAIVQNMKSVRILPPSSWKIR